MEDDAPSCFVPFFLRFYCGTAGMQRPLLEAASVRVVGERTSRRRIHGGLYEVRVSLLMLMTWILMTSDRGGVTRVLHIRDIRL
jgi:hypothetical protein